MIQCSGTQLNLINNTLGRGSFYVFYPHGRTMWNRSPSMKRCLSPDLSPSAPQRKSLVQRGPKQRKSRKLLHTKLCIYCHTFYLSCSILPVNRLCSITNTKSKCNIVKFLGHCRITVLQILLLIKCFPFKFQQSIPVFHYKNDGMHDWAMSELKVNQDDNTCELVYKKYHQINYQNDTKYHITLTIVFSVIKLRLPIGDVECRF